MTPAASLALLLMLYLGLASSLLGHLTPAYCWRRDSLSHLGQHGQALAQITRFALFLPIAAGCGWLALQTPLNAPQHWLSLSLALGYLGAVIWPLRSYSHTANRHHYLAGAVEYVGGAAALFWASWQMQQTIPLILGGLTVLGSACSQHPAWRQRAGQWQRLAEACLFLGQYLLLRTYS